jgi:hypothetical protein
MTLIRVKKNWKDFIEQKPHKTYSRRDFLSRGIATATASIVLPHAIMGALIKKASASQSSCPGSNRAPGGIAQLFREGGPSIGAMFLNEQQVNFMSSSIAATYGISGAANIKKVGSNWYLDVTSPFAIALMTAPPGISQTQWDAVLMNTSLGGHYGPFFNDDGAGRNLGQLGGISPWKSSQLGIDLAVNHHSTLANWANGMPTTSVPGPTSSVTAASIGNTFVVKPAGITSQILTNTATASDALSQIFSSVFGAGRANAASALSKAVCGFYGDSQLLGSTPVSSFFDPTQISSLTSAITVASLSVEQQGFLAAFYQSAVGAIGVVSTEQSGQDYHLPASVSETVAPGDFEAGQIVQMFIAANYIAQTKGAMIINSNGNAFSKGTAAVTVGPNSVATNVSTPQGDSGGSYNAGFILAYGPSSPPTLNMTGTFSSTNGTVRGSPAVSTVPAALGGLYLTAMGYLGFDLTTAMSVMQSNGLANPSSLMLI